MDSSRASLVTYLKLLAEAPHDGTPVVLETERALSLHFDLHATQSLMSRRDPNALVLGYTRAMMGFLLLHPEPARIGRISLIGLGGGSLAKYCYHHLPGAKVVAVEIDPAVIALRETFHIPPDGERFEVVCADGADYVQGREARPDVILVDGFLAGGMPARLGSPSFYEDCLERLADDGVLVANFLEDDEQIPFYLDAVRAAFGEGVSLALSEDGCNYTLFAWKGGAALPPLDTLLARAQGLEAAHPLKLRATARRLRQGRRFATERGWWQALGRRR